MYYLQKKKSTVEIKWNLKVYVKKYQHIKRIANSEPQMPRTIAGIL